MHDHDAIFTEVLRHFDDSSGALARALGESTPAVCNWRTRGIPANRCKAIEALTGIPARRMRPHDWHEYWPEPEKAPAGKRSGAAA